jgi:L-iditol 2-dehydrogenase
MEVFNNVQFREPALVATVGASGGFAPDGRPEVYRRALRLIEAGKVDAAALVSHRYQGLDAIPQAFSGEHRRPGYVKGVALL